MKLKEIIIVSVCLVVCLGALYFAYTWLFPASGAPAAPAKKQTTQQTKISGNIDDSTLNKIKSFKDYGGSTLDNIGRVNPFGPLN